MINDNIKTTVQIINEKFNQESYPVLFIPYEINNNIVFFWQCGAIILTESCFQTVNEDDGSWFISENTNSGICMSSAWIPGLIRCFTEAYDYLKKNGIPYTYKGTDIICGYKLDKQWKQKK